MNFIRKVFGILSVQLSITAALVIAVKTIPGWNEAILELYLLALAMCFIAFFISIVICCSPSSAKKVPINYLLLFSYTLCESFVVAFICAMYTANSVMTAAVMTAGVTITLTLYAIFTKKDFTMLGGGLCCFAFAILSLLVFSIFLPLPVWWH